MNMPMQTNNKNKTNTTQTAKTQNEKTNNTKAMPTSQNSAKTQNKR